MKSHKLILSFLILTILISTGFLLQKNPNCPFHVDNVQYTKSINEFYDNKILTDPINGKYFYIYGMAILLTPFKLLQLNLYDGMVIITSLFQILLVILFYRYTNSILKTILMTTTLTFLTFIGQSETVIISSVFLMLYFIFRDKPHSEWFIAMACLIRLDSAIFYLFARKRAALLPIAFTGLQWLQARTFLQSDLGFNPYPLDTLLLLLLSFGAYSVLLIGFANPKAQRLDLAVHVVILLFLVLFLKFPTQKVFFFPVLLFFMFYDFDWRQYKKYWKWIVIPLILINIISASIILYNRADACTAANFNDFSLSSPHSIYFGVFQPYLDYYGTVEQPPYTHQVTIACGGNNDTFIAEDWRNSQLRYSPLTFCLELYDGRYD